MSTRSSVFEYFSLSTDKNHFVCHCMVDDGDFEILCEAKISRFTGLVKNAPTRASNLKRHLKRFHPKILEAVIEKDNCNKNLSSTSKSAKWKSTIGQASLARVGTGVMEEQATMPSNAQEFCLRWNNFHLSLVTALDGFKNDLDFVDVTLACEGQYLKAHKMLLSACSVFFRDLLKANPCPHPIIILPPEVRFVDLEKMLRFIYQGEVNVQQDSLARFLKTAEMLKIRGLADDNDKQKVLQSSPPRPPENSDRGRDSTSVSPKRPRLSLDTPSSSMNEPPPTPNDENSRLSGADSDSEMIPVKQEMIELKDCDFDNESDTFLQNSLDVTSTATSSSSSSNNAQSSHPIAPPPPGPLLPSYVPPPQAKASDDCVLIEDDQENKSHEVSALEDPLTNNEDLEDFPPEENIVINVGEALTDPLTIVKEEVEIKEELPTDELCSANNKFTMDATRMWVGNEIKMGLDTQLLEVNILKSTPAAKDDALPSISSDCTIQLVNAKPKEPLAQNSNLEIIKVKQRKPKRRLELSDDDVEDQQLTKKNCNAGSMNEDILDISIINKPNLNLSNPSSAHCANCCDVVTKFLENELEKSSAQENKLSAFCAQLNRKIDGLFPQQNQSTIASTTLSTELFSLIPVSSKEDFKILETKILNEKNRQSLVKYLSSKGSGDVFSITETLIGILLSNSFSRLCSWTGRSKDSKQEKITLKTSFIIGLIKDVIKEKGLPLVESSIKIGITAWHRKKADTESKALKRI